MNRLFLVVGLILACGFAALGQKQQTTASTQTSGETSATASSGSKGASIQAGTQLAGQLQSTLDASKARVGDQVVLKTTEAVRSDGHVVVKKGARLIGNVTSVAQKTKAHGESQIGILFNRLEDGSITIPISATISSVTQAHAQVQSNDDMFTSDLGATSSSSMSVQRAPASGGSRGNGGLLGGVTSTAGGVVNNTTSTVGSAANTATGTVGGTLDSTTNATGRTTSGLGRSAGRLQITGSSATSAEGSSMLTLQGDNLRLEKGTTFSLLVNQSTSIRAGNNQ